MLRKVRAWRFVHKPSGQVLATSMEVPATLFGRGLGLQFRRSLPKDHSMFIKGCNGIHMFFMNFPLDVVFMDRLGLVISTHRGIKPWRVIAYVGGADSVMELPAGALAEVEIAKGDQMQVITDQGEYFEKIKSQNPLSRIAIQVVVGLLVLLGGWLLLRYMVFAVFS